MKTITSRKLAMEYIRKAAEEGMDILFKPMAYLGKYEGTIIVWDIHNKGYHVSIMKVTRDTWFLNLIREGFGQEMMKEYEAKEGDLAPSLAYVKEFIRENMKEI